MSTEKYKELDAQLDARISKLELMIAKLDAEIEAENRHKESKTASTA